MLQKTVNNGNKTAIHAAKVYIYDVYFSNIYSMNYNI